MDQEINVIIPLVAYLIIMNNVVVVVLVAIGRCIRVMMKYGPMTHVDPCDRPQRLFGRIPDRPNKESNANDDRDDRRHCGVWSLHWNPLDESPVSY